MTFCSNCGTQVDGSFCSRCGAPVAAGPGGYAPPPPAASVQAGGLADNVASALCYLLGLFTGILFLILEPYNKNKLIRFHAFQSIFMHVAIIAIAIALSIVFAVIVQIPFLGPMITMLVWPIYGLAGFALWLMLMYRAYNNQKWVLPVVGPMAEKQA